jgi:competence protein ComEA
MDNLNNTQKIFLISITSFMLIIIGYYIMRRGQNHDTFVMDFSETASEIALAIDSNEDIEAIIVHITGEVRSSGILYLTEGARIADAIERAGGITTEADLSKVNLAYMLSDGQRIYIPHIESRGTENIITEENGESIVVGGNSERTRLININRATQTELETLAGIGPSTALRIIEHRRENGNFRNIDDLKNVSGIGETRFEAIRNNITI